MMAHPLHVEQSRPRRLEISFHNLIEVIRRFAIFGGKPRAFDEQTAMEVCFSWHRKHWHRAIPMNMNVHLRRGLVHVTLCAHEGVRAFFLRHRRPGFSIQRGRYVRTIYFQAFMFVLVIGWCHTINFERLEPQIGGMPPL